MLVDAGPLVALLNSGDGRYDECMKVLRSVREPLETIWPAIEEAMHLLRASWFAQNGLWERIVTGAVVFLPIGAGDFSRMRTLMEKYRDLPMDLSDAGLVCVAEREKIARIFTIDRRGFALPAQRYGALHDPALIAREELTCSQTFRGIPEAAGSGSASTDPTSTSRA